MLASIGIILISKQIPLALGYDQPDFWTSGFLQLFSPENILGSFQNFKYHTTRVAILFTAISLIVLILLQQSFAKKLKVIPAPLLVVIIVLLQILFSQMLLPTFH